ncbi:DMT family transporter [Candidatus Eisenbacteria bacterium]|uniref:DMT family transporter n=1 Tax=Eiseniibacteriota bacterium TaxID=2212470 RepID=A0ABV6YJ74_UNCEI
MGEIYAITCAIVWALAVMFFKRSGEDPVAGPLALNVYRIVVSMPLILITMIVTGTPILPSAPVTDYGILLLSGLLGIAIADTLFHRSLNLVGAGINAITGTCYSPFTILLAMLFLNERVGMADVLGMALILGAVLLTSTLEMPEGRTRGDLFKGIGYGIATILFLVVSIIIVKPVLSRTSVLWAVAVRQFAALVVVLGAALVSPRRTKILAVLRPSPAWRFMLPGTFLGSYTSLILWIAGFKYTLASVAAILTQSATVFILIFAVIFLHEKMTKRKALAACLAIAGVLLVTLL